MIRQTFRLFLTAALLLGGAPLLSAAPDDPQAAAERLQATVQEVVDMFYAEGNRDLSLAAREQMVRDALDDDFSFRVMVQRAFGRNWRQLSADQQDTAVDLLARLILRSYTSDYGETERPTFAYDEPNLITDKRMEVASEVSVEGKTYKMLYRLARLESGWQVYDVLVEGVSLVGNYRKQFDSHFQRGGDADDLLSKLRAKLAEGEA